VLRNVISLYEAQELVKDLTKPMKGSPRATPQHEMSSEAFPNELMRLPDCPEKHLYHAVE